MWGKSYSERILAFESRKICCRRLHVLNAKAAENGFQPRWPAFPACCLHPPVSVTQLSAAPVAGKPS